jgi:predicted Rossmann fold nucleotide-binding protein DprA/Smf involved in DNA uptake
MDTDKIQKIVSGGQTGADRAAFDFALANGIEMSGFVPKNRRAEDGRIPDKYPHLIETKTQNYAKRTKLNVRDSDATLIFSHGELTGGSLLTLELAERFKKPFLHIDLEDAEIDESIERAKEWLASINCRVLNVAGSRASKDEGIYPRTKGFLKLLFD